LRGARVKNIVRELNNEKVDIIRWSDDIRLLVTEALKPAEIKSITVDEAKKSVLVKVDEEELSKAIGRRGQKARQVRVAQVAAPITPGRGEGGGDAPDAGQSCWHVRQSRRPLRGKED
jgi:predicted RNA-binding protein YlqC (UPF0109 family)